MVIKSFMVMETPFTWDALKAHAERGTLKEIIQSGDEIPVTLKNGEQVTFVCTYDKTGKAFFVAKDCLKDDHRMNRTWTNQGGWEQCEMREYLNSTVFDLLPDDLAAAIAPTTITQVIDGERVCCTDKLFLLSATQVFGDARYTYDEPEDSQLDIFLTERSRVKEMGDEGTWFWWLRSPYSGDSYGFVSVGSSGAVSISNANYSYGVAPGFCL